jgi:hypothetical protein
MQGKKKSYFPDPNQTDDAPMIQFGTIGQINPRSLARGDNALGRRGAVVQFRVLARSRKERKTKGTIS